MLFLFKGQVIPTICILLRSIKTWFLILMVCFVTSCSQVPAELRGVDELIETNPDSALLLLRNIHKTILVSESNRALHSLLLFRVLERLDMPLVQDSTIKCSIRYYLNENDLPNLAECYYYQGRMYQLSMNCDKSMLSFLSSLDCLKNSDNYNLLGKVYASMADVCSIQLDINVAITKYLKSIEYFRKARNSVYISRTTLNLGRAYRVLKRQKRAMYYYRKVLSMTNETLLKGRVYQEMGLLFYGAQQLDSAEYYLRLSLKYPYKSTNYCIRCAMLSDLLFDIGQNDSSAKYAIMSLRYPGSNYNRRDCYRILANYEYSRNNQQKLGEYIRLYQDYTDSVRLFEKQTKATVIENFHETAKGSNGVKRNMTWFVSIMLLVVLTLVITLYLVYKSNWRTKSQIATYKNELADKKLFVNQLLENKLHEVRESQKQMRKKSTAVEREALDKELYNKCLHLDNWDAFSCEMNHAFNEIVDILQNNYEGITQKEIIWCCLNLLAVPNTDRILLLSSTTQGLYKLKQRLAQKLNLRSTKELDLFLRDIVQNNK